MSQFKADTVQVNTLAASISLLAQDFDTNIKYATDAGTVCGSGCEALEQLRTTLQQTKVLLLELMNVTVQYLQTTSAAFDEADTIEAAGLMGGKGWISDSTLKKYVP